MHTRTLGWRQVIDTPPAQDFITYCISIYYVKFYYLRFHFCIYFVSTLKIRSYPHGQERMANFFFVLLRTAAKVQIIIFLHKHYWEKQICLNTFLNYFENLSEKSWNIYFIIMYARDCKHSRNISENLVKITCNFGYNIVTLQRKTIIIGNHNTVHIINKLLKRFKLKNYFCIFVPKSYRYVRIQR